MSELEEAWAIGLADAEAHARALGRTDVADYLALRSSNDLIRRIAGDWLFTMFSTAAGEANRAGAGIQISTDTAHRFKIGNASMVGTRLSLGSGVRLLVVELGWPRTPRDGFIRGGGLACGNIKHVGIKPANEELRLILNPEGTPSWIVLGRHGAQDLSLKTHELHELDVKDHLAILLDDMRKTRTGR
ncbi:MAG TPA: hypothetical protein VGO56_00005 [Pyrinomonadaceae bacterium]|nr:hypothetical protein [Pyrinomonadaceae bacterium]